jgi:hypothetical protein
MGGAIEFHGDQSGMDAGCLIWPLLQVTPAYAAGLAAYISLSIEERPAVSAA